MINLLAETSISLEPVWASVLVSLGSLGVTEWDVIRQTSTLTKKNDGSHIADLPEAISELRSEVRVVASKVTNIDRRVDRVEHQLDTTLIPNQAGIVKDIAAIKARDDD